MTMMAADGAEQTDQAEQARRLVERVVGARTAASIVVEIEDAEEEDWFEVRAESGRVTLRAGSPIGIAVALRHYLVHACRVDVSWDRAVPVPDLAALPDWQTGRVETRFRLRYHLNYCTFGYSTAYWTWDDWEREIDWMALHGVNLPLAIVGYEAIWLRVLQRRGLTEDAALAYLGSPAFLPWLWMGCVHDHGAPLTRDWVDRHLELGRRIVERQRALGMRVVLPAFAGYLPAALAAPENPTVEWFGFQNSQLRPDDPLFRELGLELLTELEREFGTDHYYALDPFIEGRPPYDVPAGVGAVARAINGFLDDHDPRSVWVLQAWPFGYAKDYWTDDHVASFLSAVPRGRLLVLDLWAEQLGHADHTAGFHGHDWAWCMLNNFGGRTGSHGAWDAVAGLGTEAGGALGTGFTMEALDRNAIMFELMADAQWPAGPVSSGSVSPETLAAARYGSTDPRLGEAMAEWVRLSFRRTEVRHPYGSIVTARPSLAGGSWPTAGTMRGPYPDRRAVTDLEPVWSTLIELAEELGAAAAPGLLRDVTDLGLEVLAGHAVLTFESMLDGHRAGDADRFDQRADHFLAIIAAMDRLAASHPRFLLGGWLDAAGQWGRDAQESHRLRIDAKLLITSWVAPGHPLNDYAGRHWSGLLDGYYGARWRLWIEEMRAILQTGRRDADRFEIQLRDWEQAWLDRDDPYPAVPAGATVPAAREAWRTLHSAGSGD